MKKAKKKIRRRKALQQLKAAKRQDDDSSIEAEDSLARILRLLDDNPSKSSKSQTHGKLIVALLFSWLHRSHSVFSSCHRHEIQEKTQEEEEEEEEDE